MQRYVESKREVKYCHSCTWTFSYAGVIRAVHILVRHMRYFDRSVTRLQFIAAVFRKYENGQAIQLALQYCRYGQMQIVVV